VERATRLESERLIIDPLRIEDAEELAPLLGDPALYAFTGGGPPGTTELRERFARQVGGASPDGRDLWLNWVVRERASGRAVGMLQATVKPRMIAEMAWVIGTEHQGYGFAREGALVLAGWLRAAGVLRLRAHIRAGHRASEAVASAIGLAPTGTLVDGEVRWEAAASDRP
jgi:RimJ/RimL family protein N-acetyltransferase